VSCGYLVLVYQFHPSFLFPSSLMCSFVLLISCAQSHALIFPFDLKSIRVVHHHQELFEPSETALVYTEQAPITSREQSMNYMDRECNA
jgi:hypothetical protein